MEMDIMDYGGSTNLLFCSFKDGQGVINLMHSGFELVRGGAIYSEFANFSQDNIYFILFYFLKEKDEASNSKAPTYIHCSKMGLKI